MINMANFTNHNDESGSSKPAIAANNASKGIVRWMLAKEHKASILCVRYMRHV